MRIFKRIGSMTSTLLSVFLFSYSVSVSLEASMVFPLDQGYGINKSGTLPANPDNQCPFEEKDEKSLDEFQDSLSIFCIPTEVLSVSSDTNLYCIDLPISRPDRILANVPIYLANGSFLI